MDEKQKDSLYIICFQAAFITISTIVMYAVGKYDYGAACICGFITYFGFLTAYMIESYLKKILKAIETKEGDLKC